MDVELLQLLFDFGLVVLIWLVQLVIYPSFRFYKKENLLQWHKKYTTGISIVVIPLMFGQLLIATLQFIIIQNTLTIGSFLLIALVWIITFSQFVPMHRKIAAGQFSDNLLQQLEKRNWWRTILWSIIFTWTCLKYYSSQLT